MKLQRSARPVRDAYWDGIVRQVYVDTGELIPIPSGPSKRKPGVKEGSGVRVKTQEDEDREWARLRKARSKKKGKKAGSYQYGKDLATNMAAPFIARLRREAARNTFVP
jgi:hypothetical protein